MTKIIKDFYQYTEMVNEQEDKQKGSYEAYVRKMLDKYGVNSPSELEKEKKASFFKELDAGWESKEEKGAK